MAAPNQPSSQNEALGSSQIAERLRSEILSGRLADGSRVTEADLSKRFAVSRGQAREALQRLSAQGLLRSRMNCGAVVAPEAPMPIRRLIVPIRRSIETYALELVFDELSEGDLQQWEEILTQMRIACEQLDYHSLAELDLEFHRRLIERAEQPDLSLIWETLVSRIRSHFRRTHRRCKNVMEIYHEHRLIVDTFRHGTLAEATKLLKEKID